MLSFKEHWLSVMAALFPDLAGKTVIDFGCGDGDIMRVARDMGAGRIVGIDRDPRVISLARQRDVADELICGGPKELDRFDRCDCLIAANVLGFLTGPERHAFLISARRLLKPSGHLVVSNSNELFNLFALNKFTVSFFKSRFRTDVTSLLTRPHEPKYGSDRGSENPLLYPAVLRSFGFETERTEYVAFHERPPRDKPEKNPTYADTLLVPEHERWKLMFQCSVFAVRAKAM